MGDSKGRKECAPNPAKSARARTPLKWLWAMASSRAQCQQAETGHGYRMLRPADDGLKQVVAKAVPSFQQRGVEAAVRDRIRP